MSFDIVSSFNSANLDKDHRPIFKDDASPIGSMQDISGTEQVKVAKPSTEKAKPRQDTPIGTFC